MICEKFAAPIERFQIGSIVRRTDFSASYRVVDTANNGAVVVEIASRIRFETPQKIKEYYLVGCLMAEARSGRALELPDSFIKFACTHDMVEAVRWLYGQPMNVGRKSSSKSNSVTDPIDQIVRKCVQVNPLHRYADLSELLAELLNLG